MSSQPAKTRDRRADPVGSPLDRPPTGGGEKGDPTGPGTTSQGQSPCPALDPFDPAVLRRAARLRRLRELGLLLSLATAMGVIASYAWHDAMHLDREHVSRQIDPAPPTDNNPLSARDQQTSRAGVYLVPRSTPDAPRPTIAPGPTAHYSPIDRKPDDRVEQNDFPLVDPIPCPREVESRAIPVPWQSEAPLLTSGPMMLPRLRPAPPGEQAAPDGRPPSERHEDDPALRTPPASAPRFLVGDGSGRALVSRLYTRSPIGPVVLLPDGSLGWPEGEVPTDRPFQPWSARRLSRTLLGGPFPGFRAVERQPYLVLTEGSDDFARDAADLLQTLYRELFSCLEDGGLPVREPEFPLVVIIFRDEDAFRTYRRVGPDVRAYFEVSSNRVIFYEHSEHDDHAPELARIRHPQAIAHEGVHQIFQNIGVQPRLGSWPSWLAEGLAEYYAPPPRVRLEAEESGDWEDYGRRRNFGRINPFHMATLMDLRSPSALADRPLSPGTGLSSREWGVVASDKARISRLFLLAELTPADYAMAWSLTHYLATSRPNAFRSYLISLGRQSPLEPQPPDYHLKEFLSAFGLDPATLSHRIDAHLSSLSYERVPFYAVRFEQSMGPGHRRRCVLVTPSPTTIDHWLRAQPVPGGGPVRWWATPFESRDRARNACESWLINSGP